MLLPPIQIWFRLSALLYAGKGPQLHQIQKEAALELTNSGATPRMIRKGRFGRPSRLASLGTTFCFDKFWRGGSQVSARNVSRKKREIFPARWRIYRWRSTSTRLFCAVAISERGESRLGTRIVRSQCENKEAIVLRMSDGHYFRGAEGPHNLRKRGVMPHN